MRYRILSVIVALLILASDANAQNRVKGEYANTLLPRSAVGQINAELSSLCRKGLFKQRRVLRLSIGYVGQRGRGITGVAQRGWNLYDPLGKAEADRTYHFANQGFSDCRVYVAVTPPPRVQQ